MKYSLIILLLLTFAVSPRVTSAYGSSAYGFRQQPQVPAEEYAVYDAVIDRMFPGGQVSFEFHGKKFLKQLVISDRTEVRDDINGVTYPRVDPETFGDFVSKKKAVSTLVSTGFRTLVPHIVIDSDDYFKRRRESWGTEDHKNRDRIRMIGETIDANGLAAFSRVGFDANRTHALVLMSYWCGGLCGHGFAVSLTKTDSGWKVQKVTQLRSSNAIAERF